MKDIITIGEAMITFNPGSTGPMKSTGTMKDCRTMKMCKQDSVKSSVSNGKVRF
ncbi:hypothetical protein [Bacillus sp. Marseille-Q3570]|uniref:hypothetical protein n=1 Tax=Bacillus sp. Marseille-Q3570 TaxID=2963522 RepID=UPI0021B77465|nr:hypothetical protein [Bacillus sp. Marseille-Q3570]